MAEDDASLPRRRQAMRARFEYVKAKPKVKWYLETVISMLAP